MSSDENIIATPADNSMACEAISAKLIEVSHVAESLDGILHDTQDGLNIFESSVAAASSVDRKATNNSDDWNCSLKSSTEDESFVTASEYTPSRSSSYHTASECRGNSPWWTESTERSSIDLDSSDPEQQTMKLAPAASSTNASFDDSETSFRSPISFHDHTDSDNTAIMKTDSDSPSPVLPPKMPSPLPDYSEHVHENKIYTIFESPTSSPSHDSEEADGDSTKVAEPYLQVDRSAKCIEKTLDAFSSRQLQISDVWEHWNVSKEINVILEQIMAENVETLTLTAKIEKELYPIIATSEQLPSELIRFVGSKWQTVQNEIHEAERDLSQRIDKIDKLEAKDQVSNDKIVEVKNNLNSIKTKLFTIGADYSELVDTILGFLNSYQEVYESIREYFAAKDQPQPLADNVENLIRDYEIFKSNTMERFRSLLAQSESVIDKIKMQEPPDAKEHDTDKIISLLERLRTYFETNAASENSELKRQYFIQEFDKMLTDLNENINDLQLQFNDMQEKFGESAATCKVASLSFEYFERNVDLLNKRIETFINSYKNSTISYPDTKPYVDGELDKLQRRWNDFKNNSDNLKRSMTLSQQYFNLLESVETRYHKAYTFLVNSANIKKEELKSSDSAFKLIDELEKYVIENKEMQMNDLRKLSQLSKDIFAIDKTENLNADNIFIFQSFEKLKSDIVDLVKDLKAKEDPIAMINEIDKSILVIESSEEATKLEVIHEIVPVVENDPPKFLKYLESSEVMEGKTFVFECIVQGTPEPSIQWLKYNSPISNGPHYQILNENGKCRLEIISVTMSDAAVYSCIATNLVGTSQSTANLIVNQMPQEEVHLLPPTFVKMLQNAYADERSSFEFACLVAGNPLPTVQWFRNDFCVDNDPRYSITYNNGNAILKIASVKIEDQGIFTVKASNQVGYNECSAILSVEAVEQHLKPLIKVPLSNVVTQAGQKFNLECEIAGHPRPEIIWMHNGRQLSDHDVKLQFDDEKVKLTIAEALPKDSGIYRLIARNVVGEASTECYVSVESYIPIVKPSVPETIAPSIQLPLKDTSVFEGKPIRLDCVIVGQPEPEVIWLQNNKPVKESKDIIELIFQGDRCTLYIHEAFLEDAGEYKVVAINTAGEATSECCVTVTPLNIAEPAIRPQTERLVLSEMPPKFEKLLVDILANEGESIELECCLANGTLPEIQWYLNNKEITYNDRIQSVAKDDGTLKLIIRNVLPDDKGVYTVKATNSTGVAKCFSHLIVKSTANSSDTQVFQPEPEDKQVCPTFKELFADRCVSFEDSTKFECIVYGKPTPKIRWFFNDQPVQGRDFLVSTSGERQVLTIPKVSSQTTGKISCVAENDVGKATCVAFLTLNTTGIPPSVEEQYTTQEDTSGSSFVTMQKHITTSTTTKQSSIYGNGTPSQSQFHSTSEQVDSSYKKIGDASPEISESKKFEEFRESSNEPQQTFAQKLLNFTKNDTTDKHESIIANSGQISTGKPVRRNIAPRFVTPLIGKIVDQGVDVILEGIVDGYPSPTIEITKNDEKLEDISGKVEIYYNLNKVNIKLYDVSTKDAGRYSAIAKNDAGSATSTADLVVKKSIFPPVFGRRLQAQAVKKGERVIMDVEITGTPEPQISWFKDDQPLAQVMSSEYRLSQLGNCHKLIIENATLQDSGKYMVKAINSGGEAQSIADFMVLESQPDRMVEITKTVVFSDLPTEPLKSDQIGLQSIPEQNGLTKENYTAHQESTSQAQLGSSTESKVVMETTRTTSATMRLEHKPNFPDLPVTFSQRTQTPTIPLISEGTTMDARAPETKKSVNLTEATQNEQFIKKESLPTHEPLKMPEFTVPVMPEVEPIKQSALDFFENNLKNLPPLAEEKYTRYEDVVKNNKQYMFKRSDIKAEFKSKLDDDLSYLNLKPEPPPEMGFMRKIQPSQPEKISEKVKKLEEIHQTSDTPLSGTIYPQQFKKEERYEKKEFHSSSTVSTSPFVVPQTQSPHPPAAYIPHINRDQLFSDMNAMRSPSPKPSTEAVNMEKLWTMKIKSPEPFLHQQQNFTHEQKSSFVAYSSSQTHQTQKHDFVPPKEVFVPIQPYPTEAVEEQPKPSIKDTKSFFEQRIKEEEQKSVATGPSELKAPGLVRQFAKPMVPLIPLDIEPGAPPEICYAPKPVLERKQSYVEKIEKSLEQNIAREPEKVPHGAVRILPQQQTPQRSITSQSPQRFQTAPSPKPIFHQPVSIQSEVMKPEPIAPAPQVPSRPIYQETAPIVYQLAQEVPYSKQRQTMSSSEYRSENIEIKKEISNVDNLPGYRSVQPPKFSAQAKSSEPTPVAPVQFEIPIQSSKQQEPVKLPEPFKATTFVPKVEPPKDIPKPQQQFAPQPPTVMRQVPIVQSPAQQQPSFMRQVPIVQSPVPQQFVQHQMKPTVKPKPKFGEFVSESHETHSLYKNFVRSEESTHSTESYFQKIESPKLIQQPQQPQQQFKKQEPPKQYIQPPNTQQVRKKPYPDVML